MAEAPRDQNFIPTALFESSSTPGLTLSGKINQSTGRVLVDSAGGGSVTDISIATANGFAGTSDGDPTTPTLTISTTVTGILQGNGTAISAITVGTGLNFAAGTLSAAAAGLTVGSSPIASGTSTRILYDNAGVLGEYTITGTGTVVAMQTNPTLSGLTMTDATNIVLNTTTGTKIGTATTQKLAFYNSTPIVKPTGDVATALSNLGLVGTPTIAADTVSSANEATDTTCFPLFITASGTQTLQPKNNTSLTFNSNTGGLGATTFNGLTITSTTGTLTITNGKTLSVTKSLTLDGTDSTTMTFPTTSATIARTDAAQTFTGIQTFAQIVTTPATVSVSSNAGTITRANRINNFTNSSAATMTITLSTTGALDGDMLIVRIFDFSAVAQTISWVNTEDSTVTAPTTSNGSTTAPLTVGFMYNSANSKWRTIAKA